MPSDFYIVWKAFRPRIAYIPITFVSKPFFCTFYHTRVVCRLRRLNTSFGLFSAPLSAHKEKKQYKSNENCLPFVNYYKQIFHAFLFNIKEIFHAFWFHIRNYLPEVINIHRQEAELSITLPNVNNFDIKQKRDGIFVLLYATNTKQDLEREKLTKYSKFRSLHKFFLQKLNYNIFNYNSF